MVEIWKTVEGFEDYEVSDLGRVKNIKNERFLTIRENEKGYQVVSLNKGNSTVKIRKVHRLVALAFIPNPENKPQVNHKDHIKTNNKKSNLEWATIAENSKSYREYIDSLPEKIVHYQKRKLVYVHIKYILDNPEIGCFKMGEKLEVSEKTIQNVRHEVTYKKEIKKYFDSKFLEKNI